MSNSTTIILVNLGTPREPTAAAVREFLAEFLSDPMVTGLPWFLWQPILRGIILRRRPARIAKLYASIWREGGSPLATGSEAIRAAVAVARPDADVQLAYRYLTPALGEVVATAAREPGEVVVVPLFPQQTGATTGTIERLVARTVQKSRATGSLTGNVRVAVPAPDCQHYITALADRCRSSFASMAAAGGPSSPEHLLVSFHGIPKRFDRNESGGYSSSCRRTYEALLAALGWDPDAATMAYQSRFGPEPWLTPATDTTLVQLASRGVRSVVVTCPGFLTEGLETLEEIGIAGREQFQEAGGEHYALAAAVEDHPELIRSLVGVTISPA